MLWVFTSLIIKDSKYNGTNSFQKKKKMFKMENLTIKTMKQGDMVGVK